MKKLVIEQHEAGWLRASCDDWFESMVMPNLKSMKLYGLAILNQPKFDKEAADIILQAAKDDLRNELIALRDELNGMEL